MTLSPRLRPARFLPVVLFLGGFLAGTSASQAAPPRILVPAYFYPTGGGEGDDWGRLTRAAKRVPIEAILNPRSGPTPQADPNYVKAARRFKAAGGHLLGYVHTSYGAVPLPAARAEIDLYLAQYPVDGIFLDEMDTKPATLPYYRDLHAYIKAKGVRYRVVGNPGTSTTEAYLDVADTLVTFESPAKLFETIVPAPWTRNYPPDRFAEIVIESAPDQLDPVLKRIRSHRAGSVYVTDLRLPNPYGGLPGDWDGLVDRVRRSGQAAPPASPTGPKGKR